MVNINGKLIPETDPNFFDNRGYKYGDALFETLKVVHGKILFWEDHYFRLMSSMRILRMEIPMAFTMEFLEEEILKTIASNNLLQATARIRFNVHRAGEGKYQPMTNDVVYSITAIKLDADFYGFPENGLTVDLYKDFFVNPGLLSTLKTNNKVINVLGSIFAQENQLDTCILLNTNKNVVESLHANLFMVNGNKIATPPLDDGCLKGILRKQIIEIVNQSQEFEFEERSISPFELQKADELFLTNVIVGIQPVSVYRKKTFARVVSQTLLGRLNTKIRLG